VPLAASGIKRLFPIDQPVKQEPCADQDSREENKLQYVCETAALFRSWPLIIFVHERLLPALERIHSCWLQ